MGIYVFETSFLIELLKRGRGRSDLGPRLRQGHHSLHRQERQGGRAPFLAVLRPVERGSQALLARRRHRRRLLGGQHRPHRRRARPRPLRSRLADLDLRRDHPAGQVRARRRRPARPGDPVAAVAAAASSRAPRSAARWSSPACASIPTRRSTRRSSCPTRTIGRHVRLNKVVIDSEVRIPDGLVVGEDPELDAKRFRRTENGVTPDHRPDDRKARDNERSEGSVRRLGNLSAGQDRRARRRRRRAARARCRREGRRDADACCRPTRRSGGKLGGRRRSRATIADLFGGPARVLAGRAAGLDLFVLDAPHLFDRPGNPYLGPDGHGLARQRPPLRRAGAGRRGHRSRRDRRLRARGRARPRLAGGARRRPISDSRRRGGPARS